MTHNINDSAQFVLDQYASRHPSTQHMMKMLVPNDRLPDNLKEVAENVFELAHFIAFHDEDGPELTAGLRKLLEAKDCLIRNRIDFESVDYKDR